VLNSSHTDIITKKEGVIMVKKKVSVKQTAKATKKATKSKPAAKTAAKPKTVAKKAVPAQLKTEMQSAPTESATTVNQSSANKFEEVKSILQETTQPTTQTAIGLDEHKEITYSPKHKTYDIFGVFFALIGCVVPVISILGIIFGVLANRHGSRFGKGIVILAVFSLIFNLVLIFNGFYSTLF
jgi:thiol:disulfide interchange protein